MSFVSIFRLTGAEFPKTAILGTFPIFPFIYKCLDRCYFTFAVGTQCSTPGAIFFLFSQPPQDIPKLLGLNLELSPPQDFAADKF